MSTRWRWYVECHPGSLLCTPCVWGEWLVDLVDVWFRRRNVKIRSRRLVVVAGDGDYSSCTIFLVFPLSPFPYFLVFPSFLPSHSHSLSFSCPHFLLEIVTAKIAYFARPTTFFKCSVYLLTFPVLDEFVWFVNVKRSIIKS